MAGENRDHAQGCRKDGAKRDDERESARSNRREGTAEDGQQIISA
jgi:hypothetical protein